MQDTQNCIFIIRRPNSVTFGEKEFGPRTKARRLVFSEMLQQISLLKDSVFFCFFFLFLNFVVVVF